ncbi:MAG: hypothetical protein KKG09_06190 [Verrucomicrobia bacterium]|nr:hypothetical protein [Planctomycetota bacterium]MBU4497574.1 hypothetical protein [Verrucomicrobiota bacterium]MCG2678434.1 hypothetical protein [Kiritimatiellia bacterium]
MARIAIWRSEQNLSHKVLGDDLRWGTWGFYGAQETLRQLGITFSILGDSEISDGQTGGCELIVCPDVPLVTPRQRQTMESFLNAGGKILSDGSFSLYRDARLTPYPDDDDLLGIAVRARQINPYHDSEEPNFSGHIVQEYDQGPIFKGLPRILPTFGRTRILAAGTAAQARGAFHGSFFKGTSGEPLVGAACVLHGHGTGLSLCVSPRIFRTVGLLLSSQTSSNLWISRTEYFPSADNTGGIHSWEHNAICRALRAAGWGGFPLGAYYQRLILNLIDFLCPDLPRVDFYPDGRKWALAITYDVDHASENTWFFDRWREINGALGVRSHASWLFEAHLQDASVYPHPSLAEYDIADPRIKSEIGRLKEEGYEVGLHHCHWDRDIIAREANRFKEAVGFAPQGTRGHYIIDAPSMLESLQAAGLQWDASWFNHQELATMAGVYHPVHPLDCGRQEPLSILELPTFYTEGMQTWDMYGLHPPITNERLAASMELLKGLGGLWVVAFHQNLLPISEDIYRYFVSKAREHQAWMVTGEELTRWWLAREHIRIEQPAKDTVIARYEGPAELRNCVEGATMNLGCCSIPIRFDNAVKVET